MDITQSVRKASASAYPFSQKTRLVHSDSQMAPPTGSQFACQRNLFAWVSRRIGRASSLRWRSRDARCARGKRTLCHVDVVDVGYLARMGKDVRCLAMKIIYIANIRFPTERAHGIQIAKTCEALALAGAEVELVVTDRATGIAENVQTYYHLRRVFPIHRVRVPDIVQWGRIGFLIESIFFALGARRHAGKGVVYCRDEWVLALLMILGVRATVWESHTGAWNSAARFVARRARALIPITRGLSDFYAERGIPRAKMWVAPDGVSLEDFLCPAPKEEVRSEE